MARCHVTELKLMLTLFLLCYIQFFLIWGFFHKNMRSQCLHVFSIFITLYPFVIRRRWMPDQCHWTNCHQCQFRGVSVLAAQR